MSIDPIRDIDEFLNLVSSYNDDEIKDQETIHTIEERINVIINEMMSSPRTGSASFEGKKNLEILKERIQKLNNPHLLDALKKLENSIYHFFKQTTAPSVRRPSKSNQIDEIRKEKWIQQHNDPLIKMAVEKLVECLQHVSQEAFESSLSVSIQSFLEEIGEQKDHCLVLAEERKSNLWVFQLALATGLLGETFPTEWKPLVYQSVIKEYKKRNMDFPRHIVLFDDASYSGEQLSRIIRAIFSSTKMAKNEDSNIPYPKVYLIAPYMTDISNKNIKDSVKEVLLELKIIASEEELTQFLFITNYNKILTVEEAMQDYPKELNVLKVAYWGSETFPSKSGLISSRKKQFLRESVQSERMFTVSERFLKSSATRGVVYFDHKVGDAVSFPAPLANGWILDSKGNKVYQEEESYLIAPTIPPYKEL